MLKNDGKIERVSYSDWSSKYIGRCRKYCYYWNNNKKASKWEGNRT